MKNSEAKNRYMEFVVADHLYCVPLSTVREVIRMPDVTAVPGSPADFEGMMNLRGQIMGVFNVRKKLNAKSKSVEEMKESSVVIVIEELGVTMGIIIDEVTRVLHPNAGDLRSAPLKEDDPSRKYIEGVIQVNEDLVLLLNLEHLLNLKQYQATAA